MTEVWLVSSLLRQVAGTFRTRGDLPTADMLEEHAHTLDTNIGRLVEQGRLDDALRTVAQFYVRTITELAP
jgi:hypothetical protein